MASSRITKGVTIILSMMVLGVGAAVYVYLNKERLVRCVDGGRLCIGSMLPGVSTRGVLGRANLIVVDCWYGWQKTYRPDPSLRNQIDKIECKSGIVIYKYYGDWNIYEIRTSVGRVTSIRISPRHVIDL